MTELLETEKNEDEEKVGPPGNNNQPPIAHISPRGTPGGRRVSLCGAPILGIQQGTFRSSSVRSASRSTAAILALGMPRAVRSESVLPLSPGGPNLSRA